MTKVKLDIEKSSLAKGCDLLSLIILIALFIYTAFYFEGLPDKIPTHFNALGEVDGYGNKWMIWLLPVIALILHFMMQGISKHPHQFNYPVKITDKNRASQYSKAVHLTSYMNLGITLMLSFFTFKSIQIALGNAVHIQTWAIISAILVPFIIVVIYLFKAAK